MYVDYQSDVFLYSDYKKTVILKVTLHNMGSDYSRC